MKLLFITLLLIQSHLSFATTECDAKQTLPSTSIFGSLKFDEINMEAFFTKNGGMKALIIYDALTLCQDDTSATTPSPICRVNDDSDSETIKYSIQCDQTYQDGTSRWFSRGIFRFNKTHSIGSFSCKNNGGEQIRFSLTDCNLFH